MKKTILSLALLVASATIVNAQFYVGAGLGFSSTGGATTNVVNKVNGVEQTPAIPEVKGTTTTTFNFNPEIGYTFSEKVSAGLSLSIGSGKVDDNDDVTTVTANIVGDNVNTVTKTSNWSVSPYVKYSFVSFGKFSVYGIAAIPFGGGKTETTEDQLDALREMNDATPAIRTYTPSSEKVSSVGVVVYPGIDFKLSDKIKLYANLNFFSLSYASAKTTTTTTGYTYSVDAVASVAAGTPVYIEAKNESVTTVKSHSFNFAGDTKDIFNVGGLTVGAIFYF